MFNPDIAAEEFKRRWTKHSQTKKIENWRLPAGSPMYYYCKGCTVLVDTLAETHWCAPRQYCDECQVLVNNGMLSRLLEEVQCGESKQSS